MAIDDLATLECIEGLVASMAEQRIGNFGETRGGEPKEVHSRTDKELREGFATLKTRDDERRRVIELFRGEYLRTCDTEVQIDPRRNRGWVVLRLAPEMGSRLIQVAVRFLAPLAGKGEDAQAVVAVRAVTNVEFNRVAEVFLSLFKPLHHVGESAPVVGEPDIGEKREVTFEQSDVGVHHCLDIRIRVVVEKAE